MTRMMKDSGIEWIGEIPENWVTRKIFQLFTQVKNKNAGMVETNLLSLSYGKIIRKNIETSFGLLPESFETYNIIEKNDIVLRLTDLQNDHRSLRVGLCKERGIITSAYVTIRLKDKQHAPYLYYVLHTFDIKKGFYGMGDGVRQGLNWDELKHLSLVLPPFEKQKKIANYLDDKIGAIDEIISKTEQSIEEYKKLKQSVITKAVTKGIRPNRPMQDSNIEWIGEIPTDWNVRKIANIFQTVTDYVASGSFGDLAKNVKYLDNPDYAQLIRTTDVSGKGFSQKPVYIDEASYNYLKNSNLFGGEIILPNIGASVGDVYIVPKLYKKMSLAPNSVMLYTNQNMMYFYYFFASKSGREALLSIAESTAQPKFNKTELRQLKIPQPSIQEQKEIADYLDEKCAEIDTLVEKKQQFLAEMANYKKSLICEYVTGKKEVA